MNQREKVLKGLECCRWSMQNVKPEKWKCDKCPYKDDDILNSCTVWQKCVNVLARDAYYLLNGDKLRQLPSAEPERKTGHWIVTDSKFQRYKHYKCSECAHEFDWMYDPMFPPVFNYCKKCGAKMEVEHE